MNNPLPFEPLETAPSMTDPAVVAKFLTDYAQGLHTQAIANGDRPSALAGHPYPSQFYTKCAEVMLAAAKLLVPTEAPPEPEPEAPRRGRPRSTPATEPVG